MKSTYCEYILEKMLSTSEVGPILALIAPSPLKGKTLKCHDNANLKGKTQKCHDNANLKGKTQKCHDNAKLKGKTQI